MDRIQEKWNNIDQGLYIKLVETMPQWIEKCLKAKGGHFLQIKLYLCNVFWQQIRNIEMCLKILSATLYMFYVRFNSIWYIYIRPVDSFLSLFWTCFLLDQLLVFGYCGHTFFFNKSPSCKLNPLVVYYHLQVNVGLLTSLTELIQIIAFYIFLSKCKHSMDRSFKINRKLTKFLEIYNVCYKRNVRILTI